MERVKNVDEPDEKKGVEGVMEVNEINEEGDAKNGSRGLKREKVMTFRPICKLCIIITWISCEYPYVFYSCTNSIRFTMR